MENNEESKETTNEEMKEVMSENKATAVEATTTVFSPENKEASEEVSVDAAESYFETQQEPTPVDEILQEEEVPLEVEVQQAEVDFSGLDKNQLLEKLTEVLANEDMKVTAGIVKLLKENFYEILKAETEEKLAKYLEEGGLKEEFELAKDAVEEKFKALISEFNKKRTTLRQQKEKQILENTATKKLIIEELKALMKSEDTISNLYNKFQALQSKWRSVGNVTPSESNHLWQSYQFCASQFFDFIKINKELRELDMKKNLELKAEICERAEKLVDETSLKRALEELRDLQKKWREIGYAGKEAGELIWQRFKTSADKIYERFKENLVKINSMQEENLQKKAEIVAKVDEINGGEYSTASQWIEANDKVTALWAEWQKIGHVPKSDKDATWNRFKQSRQKFYTLKDAFFNVLKEEQNKNLALKIALCEKAESLKDNTDWAKTTNEYKRIQAEWKTIGTVPHKVSDKVWKRFRKACDAYFENKQNHFAAQDAHLHANYEHKMAVLEKIKTMEVNEDNRINLEELKKLQEEFRDIGEVPYKQFESIATEYRKTVDDYFAKIKGKKGADEKVFYGMKYEQMQTTTQGKEEMNKERYRLQDKIKKLETEINQLDNNLSFFAKSKASDPIKAEFQKKIDTGKEEIKKLKEQLKLIPVN